MARTDKKYQAITRNQLRELKPWLEQCISKVEIPEYIHDDPVQFIYRFEDDDENALIAGFLSALLAWGRRDIVIAKLDELFNRMDNNPVQFISQINDASFEDLSGFKHRTFKDSDLFWMLQNIKQLRLRYGSFRSFISSVYQKYHSSDTHFIKHIHHAFFQWLPDTPNRVKKHVANGLKGGSCKRLFLFLRWTCRSNSAVDKCLLPEIPASVVCIPLDVHVVRTARKLGLITRNNGDWKALEEIQNHLLYLNPDDPSRYDYALFGIGVKSFEIPKPYLLNPDVE